MLQMTIFIFLLVIAAVLSIGIAYVILRRVVAPGAGYFTLLMLAVGVWSTCYAVELNSHNLQSMVFWASCAYFGILLVPPTWLAFTLAYTGRGDILTRRFLLLLAIPPLIVLVLVFSNPAHRLFYSQVDLVSSALGAAAVYTHGPVFWVNAVYTYVLLLSGSIILIRSLLMSHNPIRGQVIALLAAILAPWIGNGLYLSGYNPYPQFDLTPLAFVFTGLAVAWAFLRYRLLDIIPVAHAALIANLQDGLIVLDSRRRIVDLNPASEAIFSRTAAEMIGRDVAELDWGAGGFAPEILDYPEAALNLVIGEEENRRYYDLRVTSLKEGGRPDTGRLFVLRDISEQVRVGETLDRSEAILEAVSFASARFLNSMSWEDTIPDVLARFGEAARVSRAYIFENHLDREGALLASQRYEWVAEGIVPQIENPELQDFSYQAVGLERWAQILGRHELINGLVSDFPAMEQQLLIAEQIQSIIVAPIFVAGEWWGCIGMDECTFPRQWAKGELEALQAAAGVIGASIQRQQIEGSLRQRAEELTTLHEVSMVITSSRDMSALLTEIVERSVTLLGGTSGALYLCEPENRELSCAMCINTSRDYSGVRIEYGEGAVGIVAETGEPLLIGDYRTWQNRANVFVREQPFRSVLSAPLIWQQQVLGVIQILHDHEPNRFTGDDLSLLILFASQAAIALHNARAYAGAQEEARRVAMLNEITQASIQAPDLDAMLAILANRLDELFEADNTYITFWDEEHQAEVPAAAHGPLGDAYVAMRAISGEVTLTASVLNAGRVLVAEDIFYSPHISPRIAALFPARSLMALPLIADGRKLGAALIAYSQPHSFTPQEIALAEEVRTQISLAMTKIRLLDLERRRADELEALQATVTDISSERDLPSLLQAILERAAGLLRATGGDLALYDAGRNDIEIVVCHNMGKDYTGMRMANGEGALGRAVEQRQPVVIEDYQKWEWRSELFAEIPYHAVLAVPLLVRGRILGALGVVDRNPRRRFTQEDQRLLYLFSQQAATAIENARLYADEKRSASELGLLFESSTAMVKTLDLSDLYNIATDRLARAGGATSARILSCDLDSGQATVLAEYAGTQAGVEERISDVGVTYDLRDYPQTLASLRAGKPLTLNISSPDLSDGDRRELTEYCVKSALNLPMLASDRVIGYAEIWDSRTERLWSEEEIQYCQTLANQAALVIDNVRLYNQMQHLAVTDTLTGVYNRRGLLEHGQREINRAMRNARPLAAIMLDIDNFKQVNDSYSHAAGDQVLQTLALLCQENLREVDIIGRYGGEEFAILLPESDNDGAYLVAQRLRQSVAETPIHTQHGEISITVSVGVACTQGEISNLAVLLDLADTAMYEAKRAGRNLVRLT